jgi:putative FmdB family regulatory protein
MPIYEYRCAPCDHTFETLIRHQSEAAHCPKCGGIDLTKQFSVPAAAHTGSRGAALPLCESTGSDFGCGQDRCGSGMCAMD